GWEGVDIDAPRVAVCAGLYADRLLRPLGIDVSIRPERHQMCFFRRPGGFGGHPAIADLVLMTYMRPEHGDLTIHGKLSYDEIVDPDRYNEGVDPDQIVKNAELIAHRFPVMEHGLAMGGYSGLYDATPDHHPVLGAIPEYSGLCADFGWSAHGFKHSPVIGDIMSDVILKARSADYDLTPFRWTRFRDNDLVPSARWNAAPHPKHRLAERAGRAARGLRRKGGRRPHRRLADRVADGVGQRARSAPAGAVPGDGVGDVERLQPVHRVGDVAFHDAAEVQSSQHGIDGDVRKQASHMRADVDDPRVGAGAEHDQPQA